MKLIFLDWNSFGNEDFVAAAKELDIDVVRYAFDKRVPRRDPVLEDKLSKDFTTQNSDAVFSFNYFPIVSTVCNSLNLKYISWVYDSPHVALYSYTIIQPCNHVFIFDRFEYLKFHNQGINTVHYLPLATNPDRISRLLCTKNTNFKADISFVGSLYSEESSYPKSLTISPDGVETLEWLKSEYVDLRRLTSKERIELINISADYGKTVLFTGSDTSPMDKRIEFPGRVDTYNEAPIIYANSKVNLCITLKSIHTGIPLRVFDILGSKGCLLMNRQRDMDEFFTEGEDYFVYDNPDDYRKTLERLLSMDTSNAVKSAYEKICEKHTYTHRIKEMLEIIY